MIGDVLIEYLFRVILCGANLLRSYCWLKTRARVLNANCPHFSIGCPVAKVDYEYIYGKDKYSGCYSKPFLVEGSAIAYAELMVEVGDIEARVKPDDPSVSVSQPRGWANK
jgi:hypothetical protein